MLSAYRVLDLTDERGLMAGAILADLGADVIQVEPPAGSRARQVGPFVAGKPDPEGSLFWWAYARNKRGITLDLDSEADLSTLLGLVAGADCLIESFTPGYLEQRGLGYADLAAANDRLVMASITPFGQTGPKANWPATDLTVNAASGYQLLCGDDDRAPLRIAMPQAFLFASMDAAVGTLVALRERHRSGRGQHVDVSAQLATARCCSTAVLAGPWHAAGNGRMAGGIKAGHFPHRFTYPAIDGYVSITFSFGGAIGPATRRLMDWVCAEGFCDVATRDKDWMGYAALLQSGAEPLSELVRVHEVVAQFTATRTKAELFAAARERGLLIAPISTIADVRHDPHLTARDFWVPASPDDPSVRYPGPFAKFSKSSITYRRRAPQLGEHNDEVGSREGTQTAQTSAAAAETMQSRAVPDRAAAAVGGAASTSTAGCRLPTAPLQGLKVVDLTWVYVGPSAVRVLADCGATVVKVESSSRGDPIRAMGTFKDDIPGADRSGNYHNSNAGKLGLALNLSKPEARAVLKRLVQWADVLVESFTPKAMRNWGLQYETLQALNPRLIYVSTCQGGQTGPYSQFAGYGNHGAALAGFNVVCGWPDRPPAGPFGPYTDYVTPPFITAAILAALEERERSGRGQHIDVAQMEAPIHFLAPVMLDYEVNGHSLVPDGNRDAGMAPHGVFPCLGPGGPWDEAQGRASQTSHDRWIAIAVENDEQWRALAQVIVRPELATDARYATLAGRKRDEDQLEQLVAAWTRERSAEAAQAQLIAAGVPAHVVANADDVCGDPQLRQRGHYVTIAQRELGKIVVENSRFLLSRTPAVIERPGPSCGQDSEAVLSELLHLSPDEIAGLVAAGAVE